MLDPSLNGRKLSEALDTGTFSDWAKVSLKSSHIFHCQLLVSPSFHPTIASNFPFSSDCRPFFDSQLVKRGVRTLRMQQYQLVYVCGFIPAPERTASKTITPSEVFGHPGPIPVARPDRTRLDDDDWEAWG